MSGFHVIKLSFQMESLASKNSKTVPESKKKILSNISLLAASVLQCEGVIDESFRNFLHTTAQIT
jgi:hypothetical protein